ncbi:hypothetical protein CVS40_6411 [Lucilia cuprina]|nr:hypothetical protein CVS40_6411 [Lucilia cuprina]
MNMAHTTNYKRKSVITNSPEDIIVSMPIGRRNIEFEVGGSLESIVIGTSMFLLSIGMETIISSGELCASCSETKFKKNNNRKRLETRV